ncbi:MAG TPA: nitrilase-related carbon-nitrogen hydrolase [Elusimicrobiales bacterium]|nr:nitrilase-related carbon-nitrogen hydrolase [Elusimicrobiales bacterium]
MPLFRIGVVQNNPAFLRKEDNIKRCFALMRGKKADLWVLPEFFATGYAFETAQEVRQAAEPAPGGYTCTRLAAYAKKHGCAILAGLPEKCGGRYYNTAVFVTPRGVKKYRKAHLFGREKLFFSKSKTGFAVFAHKGVKIGALICFDWIFPEACRTLALKGAQVVALPANLILPWGPYVMRARGIENRVFAVVANRCGRERKLRYIGSSQLTGPDGAFLLKAPRQGEFCAVAAVDPALARDKRLTRYNDLFKDRRPELYRL